MSLLDKITTGYFENISDSQEKQNNLFNFEQLEKISKEIYIHLLESNNQESHYFITKRNGKPFSYNDLVEFALKFRQYGSNVTDYKLTIEGTVILNRLALSAIIYRSAKEDNRVSRIHVTTQNLNIQIKQELQNKFLSLFEYFDNDINNIRSIYPTIYDRTCNQIGNTFYISLNNN